MSADAQHVTHECTMLGLISGAATDDGLICVHGYTLMPGGEIRDSHGNTYTLGEREDAR